MNPSRFNALLREFGQKDVIVTVHLVNGSTIQMPVREINLEPDTQTFSHAKASTKTIVDINAVTYVTCVDPAGAIDAPPKAGQSGFLRKLH
jgi:hypothetical protein